MSGDHEELSVHAIDAPCFEGFELGDCAQYFADERVSEYEPPALIKEYAGMPESLQRIHNIAA